MWTIRTARKVLLALALLLAPVGAYAASLLPPGEIQFLDDNGNPLSGGEVDFFVPSTTTRKNTWSDPAKASLNTNPVELDAAGRAIIYGEGSYRMILKDADGVTIYDALTAGSGGSTGSSSVIWGGTSGGSANAQTITATDFTGIDGQVIAFVAGLTNTGALTIDPSNFAATAIRKDLPGGPVALVGGEVRAGNLIMAVYDSSAGYFHLVNQPDPFGGQAPAGIAASATTDVLGSNATVVSVTGSAVITSLGTRPNQFKIVYFTGINTLTHNATTLILPGGTNIVTAANDVMGVISDGSGNARLVWYQGDGVETFNPAADNLFTAAQSITIPGDGPVLNGVSTNAGALSGPDISLWRNSASPLAADTLGTIDFDGEDSASNRTTYATMGTLIADPTDASEDGVFAISLLQAGAAITPFDISGTNLSVTSTDAGAAGAPFLRLYRNSASPAASDTLGVLQFLGKDSGAADQNYGQISNTITDTTAGTEDSYTFFTTPVAGVDATRMQVGGGVYHPSATGGDQGNNTINFGTIYQNGTAIGASATTASFSAYKSANQSVTTDPVQVTFTTEVFDVGSYYASNAWTPPAGTVQLIAAVQTPVGLAANSSNVLEIRKNGAAFKQVRFLQDNSGTIGGGIISIIDQSNGTDVYTVWLTTADTAYTINGSSQTTFFMGSML